MLEATIVIRCDGKEGETCSESIAFTLSQNEMSDRPQSEISAALHKRGWWYQNEYEHQCPLCKP